MVLYSAAWKCYKDEKTKSLGRSMNNRNSHFASQKLSAQSGIHRCYGEIYSFLRIQAKPPKGKDVCAEALWLGNVKPRLFLARQISYAKKSRQERII